MILKDNPEKTMILLFPLITLGLFIMAALLWWGTTFVFPSHDTHPGFTQSQSQSRPGFHNHPNHPAP